MASVAIAIVVLGGIFAVVLLLGMWLDESGR